jgi:hypothetical protein
MMSTYSAPLRDMLFTMRNVGELEAVCAQPGFKKCSPELVDSILEVAGKFAAGVLDPSNRTGDVQGVR